MASPEVLAVGRRALQLYEERLRAQLEPTERGRFVAIEPDSGDYFLGKTAYEVIRAVRDAYPDRMSWVIRIGFSYAFETGYLQT